MTPAAAAFRTSLHEEHFSLGDPTSLPLQLAERRGKFTTVLPGDATTWGLCLRTGDGDLGGQGTYDSLPSVGDGLVVDGVPGRLEGKGAARIIFGRSSLDASSVVVATADGRTVHASVSGGHYLAWWPSGAEPKTVTAYGSGGRLLAQVTPRPGPAGLARN